MLRAALLVVIVAAAARAGAATWLLATSRPAHGAARLVYSSTDAIAGLDKGSGAGTNTISAFLFVLDDGARTTFEIPTGAYGGRAGWIANDAARATFANRDAPAGPTAVTRTVFATGRRVWVSAKGLGDDAPLSPAVPTDVVRVAYVVTNAGERRTHCTQFAAARCTFTPVDGGTGWRLHCRDGVADPACKARPVCGDGVRQPGEECDGGPGCNSCTQLLASCCEREGACLPAFAFGLYGNLLQYCYSVLGFGPETIPGPGLVCGSGGACIDEPIEPTLVCCQEQETVCSDSVQTSLGGLWSARHDCLGHTGLDFTATHYNSVCTAAGTCTPR